MLVNFFRFLTGAAYNFDTHAMIEQLHPGDRGRENHPASKCGVGELELELEKMNASYETENLKNIHIVIKRSLENKNSQHHDKGQSHIFFFLKDTTCLFKNS